MSKNRFFLIFFMFLFSSCSWIKKEFTNYVIGALGGVPNPVSTIQLIDQWDINHLIKVTKQDKIKLKNEIKKTTLKDIKDYRKVFDFMNSKHSEFTIGEESKVNEYSFDKIEQL